MRMTMRRGHHGKPPTRRRWAAPAFAALVVLVPSAAVASHGFTDVPSSAFYHEDADAMKQAGITNGCGGTSFCPDQGVTRGAMAAFLNRGLGRVAQESASGIVSVPSGSGSTVLLTESIAVPGVSPGTQYVKAEGRFNLYDVATGCPCTFATFLRDTTTGAVSRHAYHAVSAGPEGLIDDEIDVSWVFPVPAGVTRTYELRARFYDSAAAPAASYDATGSHIILTTIPLAADGAVGALSSEGRKS